MNTPFVTHSVYVSGVELGGFFEEGEPRVRVYDVLYQRHEVLRCQRAAAPARQDVYEPRRQVVALGSHPGNQQTMKIYICYD